MTDVVQTDDGPKPDGHSQPSPCRLAYVIHRYPAISHSFILREVQGIVRGGGEVTTISLHRPREMDLLSQDDQYAATRTEYVFPISPVRLALAHGRAFLRSPRAYVGTLAFASTQAPPGARAKLWQLFYFAEAIMVWQLADRRGVRHLHAHLANVATDVAWLAAHYGDLSDRGVGWRWSFTMHGPTEFSSVDRFNLRRKVQNAGLVLCISDYCRSQLMALCPPDQWSKLKVVHCGVDLARYPLVEDPDSDRGRPLKVLSVGRLVPEKGHAILLEAVAEVAADDVAIEVTVVGDGPEENRLKLLTDRWGLADRVHFTGPLGQDDLPGLFGSHDVFCLPSFAEGIPVVFMEAMATGLPVITTHIAGIPELISDGESGFLVPPGRPDRVAECLIKLAKDPVLRRTVGRRGRRVVESAFDAAKCALLAEAYFSDFEHS